jgi:DNA-binding NarL/FixJ family response regulator
MRILLADHHAPPLWALRTMIQEESGIDLVGEAVDADCLLNLAEKQRPELILMDKDLPGRMIEDLITALHLIDPKPIVMVMSSDPADGRMLLRIGADAFVSKGEQPDWLIHSLRKYVISTQKKKEEKNTSSL